jgi:hypothetical protein
MTAETPETLIAYCRENERVCPLPARWNELWEMLPNKVQTERGWQPPLPLILGAWNYASNLEKMLRLADHIHWAQSHGCLSTVTAFLRALPEGDWHHLQD